MRRVHLRVHTNIRKRLLIHTASFNLGLLMRQLIGVGTPRGLQGRRLPSLAMKGSVSNETSCPDRAASNKPFDRPRKKA